MRILSSIHPTVKFQFLKLKFPKFAAKIRLASPSSPSSTTTCRARGKRDKYSRWAENRSIVFSLYPQETMVLGGGRVRAEGVKWPPARTARHADVTGRGVASLRRIASTVGIRAFVQDDASRNWTTGNTGRDRI